MMNLFPHFPRAARNAITLLTCAIAFVTAQAAQAGQANDNAPGYDYNPDTAYATKMNELPLSPALAPNTANENSSLRASLNPMPMIAGTAVVDGQAMSEKELNRRYGSGKKTAKSSNSQIRKAGITSTSQVAGQKAVAKPDAKSVTKPDQGTKKIKAVAEPDTKAVTKPDQGTKRIKAPAEERAKKAIENDPVALEMRKTAERMHADAEAMKKNSEAAPTTAPSPEVKPAPEKPTTPPTEKPVETKPAQIQPAETQATEPVKKSKSFVLNWSGEAFVATWSQSMSQKGYQSYWNSPNGRWGESIGGYNLRSGNLSVHQTWFLQDQNRTPYRTNITYDWGKGAFTFLQRGLLDDTSWNNPNAFGYQYQTQAFAFSKGSERVSKAAAENFQERGGSESRQMDATGVQGRIGTKEKNVTATVYQAQGALGGKTYLNLSTTQPLWTKDGNGWYQFSYDSRRQGLRGYLSFNDKQTNRWRLEAYTNPGNSHVWASWERPLGRDGFYTALSAGMGSRGNNMFAPEIGFRRSFALGRDGFANLGGGLGFNFRSDQWNSAWNGSIGFKFGGGNNGKGRTVVISKDGTREEPPKTAPAPAPAP